MVVVRLSWQSKQRCSGCFFYAMERGDLMELSMREKELLIMFGSERRLDTHKRLQNAIPYMTDSLYKASATALWNKLYNNISDSQYIRMY